MTKSTGEVSLLERFKKRVEDFRTGFTTEMAAIDRQVNKIAVQKRVRLYAMLQEAFVIASELMLPENEAILDALLDDAKIKRRKGNPWMAVTNLLFEGDTSAKKYAVAFRLFHERGWEPELVADQLIDKDGKLKSLGKLDGKHQRGLVGAENLGRYEHSNDHDDPDVEEQARLERNRDELWSLGEPIATVPINDITARSVEDGEYVAFWGLASTKSNPRVFEIYGELVGPKYSRVVRAYLDRALREVRPWLQKHVVEKKPHGKGNRKPQLLGKNILDPVAENVRKQPSTGAGGEGSEKPSQPVRKGIKTGGGIDTEKLTKQHKPMSRERIRELAVKLANDKRRRSGAKQAMTA